MPAAQEPFATADEFFDRQLPDSPLSQVPVRQVQAAIASATNYLAALYYRRHGRPYAPGDDYLFDLNAKDVCLEMAGRSLNRPLGMAGVTQFSQTAGPFTGSATFGSSASGSPYATKADLARLGLSGVRAGAMRAHCGTGER